MKKPKFIFFDIGQVLASFKKGWDELCKELALVDEAREKFWWVWGKYTDEICALRMTSEGFNQKTKEEAGLKLPEGFDITHETVERFEPIQPAVELLVDVAKTYPLGLFSNAYPGMIKRMFERGLLPKLDYTAIIDSSELGMVKPEKEIYQVAEEKTGFGGNEILFVDNSKVNLEVAEEFGWQTYLFSEDKAVEDASELRKMLLE